MEFQLPTSHEGERSAPLSASSRKNFNSRPFQGKLRGPSDCLCTNRPHRTRAGSFQGKFHRHVRLLARQLSSTASAQGCSGKNFISPKTTAQQTAPRPRPVRRRNARHPSNHSGQTSRPVRTARPSAQPHRIRAGPLRGKLRGPADCPCTNRPYCTRAGPFQGKFHRHVRRPARQSNPISPAQGCSGENFTSQKPQRSRRRKSHAPSDGATLADPSNHSGQTSRPVGRRNDHSSARPPRPNFLRTKAPARRSPVQTGTPLTPRPATAQRCPARRWRP